MSLKSEYNKIKCRVFYRKNHITIAEKRECYATGNYEKALEKLRIKKGIKDKKEKKDANRQTNNKSSKKAKSRNGQSFMGQHRSNKVRKASTKRRAKSKI